MAGIFLKSLILNHFRSYKKEALTFSSSGTVFTGANGSGKTNILEAISLFLQVEVCENPKILKTLVSLRIMAGRYRELLKG